ncbi:hypothetical protein AN189_07455 [Loktanella sp. 3ANDIMAR09]|uniref:Lar family restriction alleviation protein n=1 Tax=Loktanella sp. 3ANDIMAR09 TaxID=1225657 RepID=UPI000707E22F|nr:Lar family restriction alleviation protein [Loktanella sp. 3ANDIMAR09]KQI68726.1 hypothetical protein AN189_07455 [Loktanella sp. 3ANDIMAR09]
MGDALKPCPFCGGNAAISKDYDPDGSGAFYAIRCNNCRAQSSNVYAVETCPIHFAQVRGAWNTRAEADALRAEVERLRGELRSVARLAHSGLQSGKRISEQSCLELILKDARAALAPTGDAQKAPADTVEVMAVDCVGCGKPATGRCMVDCGMSLCGYPVCDTCAHVDEGYGWSHKPRRTTGGDA